jgi:Predicted dehydrogenases and related proteins
LRVGVVGAGVMGSNHARVLAGLPDVTLVGIVDPLPEHRARAIALVGCRAFAELEELFEEASTPSPSRRRPISITRFRSPASRATSTSWSRSRSPRRWRRGQDIVNAARSAGVTLMVGHVERFNPAVAAIKQAISGEDILSIGITRVGPFPPRMSNVGVVIDLAVHDIDLIRWFTESESSRCSRSFPARSPSARISRCCSSAPPRACSPTSTPTG